MFENIILIVDFLKNILFSKQQITQENMQLIEQQWKIIFQNQIQFFTEIKMNFERFNIQINLFPFQFFQNFYRFTSIYSKYIQLLTKNMEALKNKLMKNTKKSQSELKKSIINIHKQIQKDLEHYCLVVNEFLTKGIQQVEVYIQNSLEFFNQLIHQSVNSQVFENQSIFESVGKFPNLQKAQILTRIRDNIGLNYKYLYQIQIDNFKECSKIFKLQ
ncbi:hypothetical protein IMG5_076300 [Ichthyophthirius multifiliis]|uniref:Uncharacterized protein n=1 Tax=Ichthyophthirius multifiliis TaxID=5932 RepID=G0QQ99_ICHMU|nr:hypothetical protein IMG5_076300 [Ichthyophthirius multifiliis]EGR32600.1 hypothetical protein IMG5_076300 [Ichthyophthirius multifiliis]|eukprot:XP_004036586.1 hypothetical protein IMG5_076300 [Ichthyophthirius multifiliis]